MLHGPVLQGNAEAEDDEDDGPNDEPDEEPKDELPNEEPDEDMNEEPEDDEDGETVVPQQWKAYKGSPSMMAMKLTTA